MSEEGIFIEGKDRMDNWLIILLIVFLISSGIALLIREFVFFVTQVSSHSMIPTFQANNRLLTLRVYQPKKLERGDIVVFYSQEKKMVMVKRLIGLPEDFIQITNNGGLQINGAKQEEPYIKNRGGKGGTFFVPKDEYFFLGDNRSGSNDSRHWIKNTIPAKDIQGKITLSLYPFYKV